MYPDRDLTGYLAADSLARDGDLAYTREDSDRYLRKYGERPSPFRVLQKKRMDSTGHFQSYFAFYCPQIFVFFLTPFLWLFGFRGWFVLHALLVLITYVIGWLYYRGKDQEALSPAINSVVYFTLVPVPLLFLLPSHHLFLFVTLTAFLFFALRRSVIVSAVLLAIAVSCQPWAALFAIFLIAHWQITNTKDGGYLIPKFVIAATITVFIVWGLERLMYPVPNVSEPRWVTVGEHLPLASIWNSLPDAKTYGWTGPNFYRLIDFLAGRNSGFFLYAFAAAALFLSSIWLLRDALVRTSWLFAAFYLAIVSGIHTSSWNAQSFVHDFWILLAPLPYFVVPLIRPRTLFIAILLPCALVAGPLLANPLGAIANRSHYTFSFPYKFFPIEISLAGRAGITKDQEHQQRIPGGKIYFLNDGFYKEGDYFWLRGESTLEFLLEVRGARLPQLEIRNGVMENKITLRFADSEEQVKLTTAETKRIDLRNSHAGRIVKYEGKLYLHGEIHTNNGYVPGLLSRDNPDYRFLSCQVQFVD